MRNVSRRNKLRDIIENKDWYEDYTDLGWRWWRDARFRDFFEARKQSEWLRESRKYVKGSYVAMPWRRMELKNLIMNLIEERRNEAR